MPLTSNQMYLDGQPVSAMQRSDGSKSLAVAGYDSVDDMLKVKSVQKKFHDSFVGSALDPLKWHGPVIGSGGSVSVSGGALTLGSGNVADAETSVMSLDTYTVPFRVQVGLTLSQRIANSTFYLEAVSVNPTTGIPDGLHSIAWQFDGTSATQSKYLVQNGGLAALVSAASTISSTASGSFYELEPFADEAWFHSSILDASTGRAFSYRRHQRIPDPNAVYKIRLRWVNGATPPVSTTLATVQFVSVQDYAELTAEITAGRGQSVAGQGIGVTIAGGTAIAVGPVAHDGARSTTAPVINAGRAVTTPYTAVATGDVADFVTTTQGAQIVRPWQIPEQEWSYAAAAGGISNTTDVVLAAAAGTGLRRYITSIDLKNISATATEVVIKDGATVLWRGHLSANMTEPVEITFYNPLKTTANAVLNFACITTGAQVYVNAQGFTAT